MPHILVIGSGSVGKRHAQNLQQLGCRISCVDPRSDRLQDMAEAGLQLDGAWQSLPEALETGSFDGVVVASPTSFHVEQSLSCLQAGLPVLLEKPVAPDLDNALRLAEVVEAGNVPLLLGYTWRWWPSLNEVRALIADGVVGRILHVHFCMSAHLADWHPWERYQDFFMSKAVLGGGALLDESHWIDQMLWFFGLPRTVSGTVGTISDLEIDADDNVDLMATFANGMQVSLHLDLYGRPHEKSITLRGTDGTLIWEVERFRIGRGMEPIWEEKTFAHARNDMFVAVAKEFLDVLSGAASPSCTIGDGLAVMRVIEALRQSSASGVRVEMNA